MRDKISIKKTLIEAVINAGIPEELFSNENVSFTVFYKTSGIFTNIRKWLLKKIKPKIKSTLTITYKEKRSSMIKVYPKIIVYCPDKKKEIDGRLCANCKMFKGVKIIFENKSVRMFFECDYKY